MNEFMQAFGPSRVLGLEQILCALLSSFVLSVVVATIYRWTYQGLSYSRSFVHTLVLAAIVTAILIMAIGNNLARGLGILGTLAIVRFRTPIRDPRDIIFLFASLSVGIACGASVFHIAIIGTLFFGLVAMYLHKSSFASLRVYEGLLHLTLPSGSDKQLEAVQKIILQHCSSFVLVAMRESMQAEHLEYSYQIRLIDPTYQSDLMEQIIKADNVSDANLLMHRATVEI
ncbi:MAG: DUF4956 domain-containing protein [Kiritimatiellales bacterium]|nr:DUF4956 domain-containing protein [Kiritimatiellales bacterium]